MRYQFNDFVLDSDRRELASGSAPVELAPQVFDLLLHLVKNREHVVTKDNLVEAVWGGRIVSDSTLTSHINAVRKAIGDTGGAQRLVRTIARKGYRFVGEVRETRDAEKLEAVATVLSPPDRPSIAVLPFVNLSGDPTQEYFVDGVVDDIISALSRMRWLFVIARNASFTYKGRAVDTKQVGRELGVRYVLEGSVRKAANRIRITGQLVDAHSGATLWSERFESAIDDLFELQDQMATSVVGALAPHLETAEIERSRQKPTANLDAHDYYMRGMWKFRQVSRSEIDEALPLFYEAIKRDPEFASAHAMAAWCHSWRRLSRWVTDPERETAEGMRLARRAVELGQHDAVALAASAHVLTHLNRDVESSVELLDRAVLLDPNLAAGWYLGGYIRIWRGQQDDAIEWLARGMRLCPLGPDIHRMELGFAMAHLLAGRITEALSWVERVAVKRSDQTFVIAIFAATYARAGRIADARLSIRRLRELDPELQLSRVREWLPFQRPEDLATFTTALREAGLPE